MQQISGRPILSQGQGGMQPGFAPQNAVQPGFTQQNNVQSGLSQPAVQMPEPQVQQENVPQNAPGLPGPMPMFTPNVGGPPPGPMPGGGGQQTMQMPEPEVPVSGPPIGPSFDERPVIPGQPGAEFGNAPPPNGMPMPGSGPMPGLMRGPTPGPMQGPGPSHVPMPEPNTGPQPGGFTSPPDGDYPSSTTASDPLDRNPLPTPPREVAIPEHLLSGSAMTQRSVRMPVPASEDLPPLRNPLPELPKDVYDSRRYRDLAVGSAAQYQNPRKVYPDGWFDRGEGGARHLGRTLTGTFAKLNPFRPHQGRPGLHRRFNTMPVPSVPGAPGMGPEGEFSTETDDMDASSEEDAPNGTLPMAGSMRQPFRRRMPFRFGRNHQQEPPSGFMTMQQLPGGGGIGPQPMHPFSPNGRGTPPPPIRFDRSHPEFAGFSLVSPHRILYKGKLYPTALHLLEAHKFGIKSGIAERIRLTENIGEMRDYTEEQQHNARRDWEVILRDKVHPPLKSDSLKPNDPFLNLSSLKMYCVQSSSSTEDYAKFFLIQALRSLSLQSLTYSGAKGLMAKDKMNWGKL